MALHICLQRLLLLLRIHLHHIFLLFQARENVHLPPDQASLIGVVHHSVDNHNHTADAALRQKPLCLHLKQDLPVFLQTLDAHILHAFPLEIGNNILAGHPVVFHIRGRRAHHLNLLQPGQQNLIELFFFLSHLYILRKIFMYPQNPAAPGFAVMFVRDAQIYGAYAKRTRIPSGCVRHKISSQGRYGKTSGSACLIAFYKDTKCLPLSPCRQTEDSIHIIRLLIRSIIKQGLSRVLRGLKAKAGKRRKTKKAYVLSMP